MPRFRVALKSGKTIIVNADDESHARVLVAKEMIRRDPSIRFVALRAVRENATITKVKS